LPDAPRERLRIFVGSFGDAGHAFPAIALARQLVLRGHEVAVETWTRWREHVEAEGAVFYPAPEYQVFPTRERPLKPYEAVVRAVDETRPAIRDFGAQAVVNDVLTLAPALAAEHEGVALATLIPHFYPPNGDALPPYGLGAMAPRTPLGRLLWRALAEPASRGVERGRRELCHRWTGLTAASARACAWSAPSRSSSTRARGRSACTSPAPWCGSRPAARRTGGPGTGRAC
jgi:UDP:flavonoid glycosyltransferase YjiC (YdhE family)